MCITFQSVRSLKARIILCNLLRGFVQTSMCLPVFVTTQTYPWRIYMTMCQLGMCPARRLQRSKTGMTVGSPAVSVCNGIYPRLKARKFFKKLLKKLKSEMSPKLIIISCKIFVVFYELIILSVESPRVQI